MANQKMKSIGIYHDYIPRLGGIESAVYNLGKGLDKLGYKVTIYLTTCESWKSLFKYAQVGDVIKLLPEDTEGKYTEDVLLIASNHQMPKQIKAKRYLQWVHSDYDKYRLDLKNKGKVEYIAVSEHAKNVIERREKVKAKVIYNLLDDDFGTDTSKVLRLVTNSRVSPEKGFGRMLQLAEKLKESGVRFVWTVFGDNTHKPNEYWGWIEKFKHIEQVQWVGFKNDMEIGLTNADYLVQLSDFEGCPYSVLEALKMGVPCLVSEWIGVRELIEDGVNGYVLPMDMEIDKKFLNKIIKKIPEFEYKPLSTVDDWVKVIETE